MNANGCSGNLLGLLMLIAGAFGFGTMTRSNPIPIPPVTTPTAAVAAAVPVTHKGAPTGLTTDGLPFLGNPDAKVTLTDYSDFL